MRQSLDCDCPGNIIEADAIILHRLQLVEQESGTERVAYVGEIYQARFSNKEMEILIRQNVEGICN